MRRTITRVLSKVRRNSLTWTFKRVFRELHQPDLPVTKNLYKRVFSVLNRIFRNEKYEDNKTLNLIYDLRNAPATFNVGDIIFSAELTMLTLDYQGINVHYVLPSPETAHGEYFQYEKIKYRLHQILVPFAQLHGCVRSVFVHHNRFELIRIVGKPNTLPHYYHPLLNIQLPVGNNPFEFERFKGKIKGIKASTFGKMILQAFKQRERLDRRIVTLVIRSQSYDVQRNSAIPEWLKFARYLTSMAFSPVLIPDTESLEEIRTYPADLPIFIEGALNIDARIAIYEESYVVMGAPGGGLSLACWNPNVPFIAMNMLPENSINNTREHMSVLWGKNLEKINDMWWVHPLSKLSFLPDNYLNLVFEFENFCNKISSR